MSLVLLSIMLVLLQGCGSWGGMKTVKVSGLQPNGYPASSPNNKKADLPNKANKTHAAGQPPAKGQKPANIEVDDDRYVIQPGDTLSVKFFFNPELNEEDLIVRPDGHISLQLVHEVKAADLTPLQLKHLLEKKYVGQLKNPEIAVIVRSVREPYRIYVDGEVNNPGEFEIIGSLSVLQAIARAGGLKGDTAMTDEVKVIRRDQNGEPFVIAVDLNRALSGRDLSQDIRLLPYDFIYIPRSFW